MISVWPKFYPTTDNAKALAAHGWLYQGNLKMGNKDWVGPGYLNTDYDAYAPGARKMYFEQMRDKLVTQGFDAWWMEERRDAGEGTSVADSVELGGGRKLKKKNKK